MSDSQNLILDNKEYLMIVAMYSPIIFKGDNITYYKIYGERNFAIKTSEGNIIKWNDNIQHNEILQSYVGAKDNRPLNRKEN
jgi:hypothetical protein